MERAHRLVLGGLAGLAATMAMTLAMSRTHTRLPERQRYPLPPRELTDRILGDEVSDGSVTTLAHFAYGAVAGAVYGSLRKRPPGLLFGVLVWGASYLGWIPLTRRLTPATKHPTERNMLMIGSHLIWGAFLGLFMREFEVAAKVPFGPGPLADAPARNGRGTTGRPRHPASGALQAPCDRVKPQA